MVKQSLYRSRLKHPRTGNFVLETVDIRGWEGSGSPLVEKSVGDGHKSNLRVFVHEAKI